MVQKTTVLNNDNLIEIAIRKASSPEAVLDIIKQTGLSVTAILEPGQLLGIDLTGITYQVPASAYRGVFTPAPSLIIVRNNQTILDIAIQETGAIEAVIDLMKTNGIPVTEDLETGGQLSLTLTDDQMTDLRQFFKGNNIRPATGATITDNPALEGIGYWLVYKNFIVQ